MVLLVVLHLVVIMMMVEVVWLLVPSTSPTRKWILGQTCMMVDFGHFGRIVWHTPLRHIGLGMKNLVLIVVIHFLVYIVMLEVVWFLVPTTSTPIKLIIGLMVAMRYFGHHDPIVQIPPWCHIKAIVHHHPLIPLGESMINLIILVMV